MKKEDLARAVAALPEGVYWSDPLTPEIVLGIIRRAESLGNTTPTLREFKVGDHVVSHARGGGVVLRPGQIERFSYDGGKPVEVMHSDGRPECYTEEGGYCATHNVPYMDILHKSK